MQQTVATVLLIALTAAFPIAGSAQSNKLSDVLVEVPEPKFVAPTRRDKIGRIWAPVLINGKGPFRLVLDTGASGSAVNAQVATALGIAPDQSRLVMLRGVTGNLMVPTIQVDSFAVGDVILSPATLPIVTDPLGGADGVLGIEGFADKRISIDFRHDSITIAHSNSERAHLGFTSISFERSSGGLPAVRAEAEGVHIRAIFDTGAQATIGNEAMRKALVRRQSPGVEAHVTDVTMAEQAGTIFRSPAIQVGSIEIDSPRIAYGDMHIFEHWHLTHEPVVLIGMDVIGLLDSFIIDYKQKKVLLKMGNRLMGDGRCRYGAQSCGHPVRGQGLTAVP